MPVSAEELPTNPARRPRFTAVARRMARPELALVLGLLVVYGATANTRALYHASLHHQAVRAMVEQGTLYVRPYDPTLPLGGDVFVHDGGVYTNKQPGSILLGAAVYRVVRLTTGIAAGWWDGAGDARGGVTYGRNFYLTAALVSLLTSGVLTALTAVLIYRLARDWTASPSWAMGTALAFGLGSTALAYAGVLHHDVVATACLTAAFAARRRPLLAGGLLGLTLTASLLPLPMIVTLAALLVFAPVEPPQGGVPSSRYRRAALLLAGLALGAAPLLAFNWASFGAPWRMPFLTGAKWPESSPRFDPLNALRLLAMYGRLMVWYAPIALLGVLGLAWSAARRTRSGAAFDTRAAAGGPPRAATQTREATRRSEPTRLRDWMLLALIGSQLLFVISLGTDGACQYGPRLLLPVMPFACLGLTAFTGTRWSRAAAALLVAVGVASFGINLMGALYGTMFCDATRFAFTHYLDALRNDVYFSFPLLGIDGELPY